MQKDEQKSEIKKVTLSTFKVSMSSIAADAKMTDCRGPVFVQLIYFLHQAFWKRTRPILYFAILNFLIAELLIFLFDTTLNEYL